MIIYEVNLTVDPDVSDEYAAWLRPHIAHILKIGGFLGAEWLDRDAVDENGDSEKQRNPRIIGAQKSIFFQFLGSFWEAKSHPKGDFFATWKSKKKHGGHSVCCTSGHPESG